MDVFKFYDAVDKLKPNTFLEIIGELVLDAEGFILFLQQEQLSQGRNEDGNEIGTYTALTEQISKNPEQYGTTKPIQPKTEGSPYNFEWSGRYFKGMFIKVFAGGKFVIEIDSTAPYADELENKYKKLLGLVDKNQDKLTEYVEQEIITILNKRLNV